MFDISFGQLLLVLIIGLVVLGPQKLPIAIKTVASWIKALRRVSATVQLELNKELRLQELQESLKQAEKAGLKDISPEIKASIDQLKNVTAAMQNDINSLDSQSNQTTPTTQPETTQSKQSTEDSKQ